MIQTLVACGCSYMNYYAQGHGHSDLAQQLGMHNVIDLSKSGSCNDRILRTVYKHSYAATEPAFYLVGLTFLNRTELPILRHPTDDGHWVSFQNYPISREWAWPWTDRDTEKFLDLYIKSQFLNTQDRFEDLMYRLLGLISNLRSRGHKALFFQQAEDRYQEFLPQLSLLAADPAFVHGLEWRAVSWQLEQGAEPVADDFFNDNIPRHMMHINPGQHGYLNHFLSTYINQHGILK